VPLLNQALLETVSNCLYLCGTKIVTTANVARRKACGSSSQKTAKQQRSESYPHTWAEAVLGRFRIVPTCESLESKVRWLANSVLKAIAAVLHKRSSTLVRKQARSTSYANKRGVLRTQTSEQHFTYFVHL
jgi:hypothetical protein